VDHQSLKDRVAAHIRRAILDGQMELGTRLIETTVAAEMGVSRGPVREAFLHLAREGLLEINPRRGASVTTLAPEDIWQLYTLRAHLEALMVRYGLAHMGPADFRFLEELVDEMGGLVEGPGAIATITELDLAFHGRIAECCPYPRMVEAYRALDSMIGACIYTVVKTLNSPMTRMQERHRTVLDGLKMGNVPVAEAVVQAHWIETAEQMRQTALVILR
jgi:DNA-binding GntR family transcriptional regulator